MKTEVAKLIKEGGRKEGERACVWGAYDQVRKRKGTSHMHVEAGGSDG